MLKLICTDKEYEFWFTRIRRCVLALYTQNLPEFCENKNNRHITRFGIEHTTFVNA